MKHSLVKSLFLLLFLSFGGYAGWSDYVDIERVEVHTSGVFVVGPLTGLNAEGCQEGQNYSYASFFTDDQTLADRALSSAYFAIASNKKSKVFNCSM